MESNVGSLGGKAETTQNQSSGYTLNTVIVKDTVLTLTNKTRDGDSARLLKAPESNLSPTLRPSLLLER